MKFLHLLRRFRPLPAASLIWILSSFATASPRVVISEIHYHPPDDPVERLEFVELHNLSGEELDIAGWQLRAGIRFRFAPARGPTRIPPRGYLVVARDPGALVLRHPLRADRVAGPYGGKLSNSGERLELVDTQGVLQDAVEYRQDGDWPARADGLGSSLQRVVARAPGHLPQNWKVGFEETARAEPIEVIGEGRKLRWFASRRGGGPGFSDPVPWYLPDFDDSDGPWRDGEFPVGCDTKGKSRLPWIRTEGPRIRGLHSLWMRAVFEVDEETAISARPRLHVDWDDGLIAWLNGVEIARDGMFQPPGTPPPGALVYRTRTLSAGGDNRPAPHYKEVWRGDSGALRPGRNVLAIGNYNCSMRSSDLVCAARLLLLPAESSRAVTPGRRNSVAASSLPPLITGVEREPKMPGSKSSVTIHGRVEGDAAQVVLHYDLGAGEVTVNMAAERLDRGAGVRVFSASIPAAPDQSIVRYRLVATSARGVSGSCPRAGNPAPHLAYFVCDAPPAGNPDLDVYHLFWKGELSCASGRWNPGATFVHGGTAFVNVRLKQRGETSCWNSKRGMRIAFNRGDLFAGQRRLNLLAG
ncbi:MAG: lamin tail domain-containing protein, partial [Planctomycetota bacterium]|nr:lamin tail domain-containing protein [Planctomycetota bacterium]